MVKVHSSGLQSTAAWVCVSIVLILQHGNHSKLPGIVAEAKLDNVYSKCQAQMKFMDCLAIDTQF